MEDNKQKTKEILSRLPEDVRRKAKINERGKISFAHLPSRERGKAEGELMVAGLNYHTSRL